MNSRIVWGLAALLFAGPSLAQARTSLAAMPKGQLLLPEMAGLADKASESVSVTLDSQLLGFASRFLNPEDPDEAAAKKIVSSLTGIYVRKYTFDTDYAYPKADIDGIRRQLSAPGWSQIVEARSRKEQTNVDVYMLVDGGKARGLAIISARTARVRGRQHRREHRSRTVARARGQVRRAGDADRIRKEGRDAGARATASEKTR